MFAATRTPACAELVGGVLRGRGAEHRAAPRPRGGGQHPGLARPRRAGHHLDGPGRGQHVPDRRRLVQPQPAARSLLMRVLRAFAQLRLHQLRVDAQAPRRQLARQPRRPPRLRVRDQPLLQPTAARRWRTARPPAACRRCARPAPGAATPGAAAIRRLQAHHVPAPPGQGLLGQAEQQLPRRLRAHLPGLGRHHQGQLLDQVVPGPGRLLLRHQRQRLLHRPGLRLARQRTRRRPARRLLARWRPGRARSTPRPRCPPAGRRAWRPTARPARPSRRAPRPCPCVTAAWRRSRCTAARARSARGRAAAPTPAPARVPSRAPARSAWNTRPSAPA